MSVTILSCKDESDPPDEQSRGLVSPGEGGLHAFPLLPHSILTLLRKVKVQASFKSKTRPGRGSLRSLVSIQIIRDDRYFLQRLAVLWRNTSPLLEYYPLSNRFPSNDEELGIIPHARVQAQTSLVRRTITLLLSPVVIVIIDKQVSHRPRIASEEDALNPSFCIPVILVTSSDDASLPVCNAIPFPQNSINGFYLTVPGCDAYDTYTAIGYRGCKNRCNVHVGRRLETKDYATLNEDIIRKELQCVKTVQSNINFEKDADEAIDLGPTWSG